MRTINQLLSGLGLAFVAVALLTASAMAQEARIAKIVGGAGATVIVGGQTTAAAENMSVPLNAEIQTTGQEVYLEVVPGVVASIRANSRVRVTSLAPASPEIFLDAGSVVSQLDKSKLVGKSYHVRTARGVAAARGTAFTVTDSATGFSVSATADSVTFTPLGQSSVTIQAGMVTYTPPGSNTTVTQPLAQAVQQNPALATVVRDAVNTVTTVVQNNIGQISSDSATNVVTQVVAVAVSAMPTEATTFTSQAVAAVTATGSATATSADAAASAAATITAAAVKSAPDQAAQIAGAAASASPSNAGLITSAAQQAAPESSKDSIAQQVAASTGQSQSTVQSNADASATQGSQAVNKANDTTRDVVTQPSQSTGQQTPSTPQTETPKTTENPTPTNTPQVPVVLPDGSNAGAGP